MTAKWHFWIRSVVGEMGSTTGGACHIGKKSREGKGDEVKVGSLKMASLITLFLPGENLTQRTKEWLIGKTGQTIHNPVLKSLTKVQKWTSAVFQKFSHGCLLNWSEWHQLHPRECIFLCIQDLWSGDCMVFFDEMKWNTTSTGRGWSPFPSWDSHCAQYLSSNSCPAGAGELSHNEWSVPIMTSGAGRDNPLLNGPTEGRLHSFGRPRCGTSLIHLLQPLHV